MSVALARADSDAPSRADAQVFRAVETVFVVMSQRFPDNVMATFSTVHDNNQRYFFEEMNADSGVPTTTTVQQREETWTRLMLHNMQRAAASAPNVRYWVEEGAGHCPSKSDAFYEWMYALIAHDDGEPLPASHACEGCSVDDIEGCDGVVGSGKVRNECGDCVDVDDFLSTSRAWPRARRRRLSPSAIVVTNAGMPLQLRASRPRE